MWFNRRAASRLYRRDSLFAYRFLIQPSPPVSNSLEPGYNNNRITVCALVPRLVQSIALCPTGDDLPLVLHSCTYSATNPNILISVYFHTSIHKTLIFFHEIPRLVRAIPTQLSNHLRATRTFVLFRCVVARARAV